MLQASFAAACNKPCLEHVSLLTEVKQFDNICSKYIFKPRFLIIYTAGSFIPTT